MDPVLDLIEFTLSSRCPCQNQQEHRQEKHEKYQQTEKRWLQRDNVDVIGSATWEMAYTLVVVICMITALVSDRVSTDSVMLAALAAFMAANIITIDEGLSGFSNDGVLSVMVLYIVAEGINKTGGLDWYLVKFLGTPKNLAFAQCRLMAPAAILSAFLNDVPLVIVLIPIVIRWSKNIGISIQQLLIPLSFAAILGGTCTIIGTTTNLLLRGLYEDRYPGATIGLFEIGKYAVPVAIAGFAYIIIFMPLLIPGADKEDDGVLFANCGRKARSGFNPLDDRDELLLGARLTPWSPAAGCTVKSSGLNDSDGIYLVSVYHSTTGIVHRAVGHDFVLNVGDILYFTGLVERFGEFCEENALELFTNETELVANAAADNSSSENEKDVGNLVESVPDIPIEIGLSRESLRRASFAERLRSINEMTDLIRGVPRREPVEFLNKNDPPQIIVIIDRNVLIVGINTANRSGLLLDVSQALLRLGLEVRHTEGKAIAERFLSIWRCGIVGVDLYPDIEEIWSTLNALLERDRGIEAVKKRGLKVIRARVTNGSTLIGRTATEVDFRKTYQAAIVAVQQGGKNINQQLSKIRFGPGDLLILQASHQSPLLSTPPEDFYDSIVSPEVALGEVDHEGKQVQSAWRDLQPLVSDGTKTDKGISREFLTAMTIPPKSRFIKKTVAKAGIDKLPGVVLISVERRKERHLAAKRRSRSSEFSYTTYTTLEDHFITIAFDEPLKEGDVLWFAGSASAVGDLRRIPGVLYYQSDEVSKIEEKVHDRRLVQAVVAKRGPLVGKTVKEIEFRTRHGAAVIAVHRDGNRIHAHPGKIKIQAGDVLLLEAGSSFIAKTAENGRSFALIAEVKDSAPPRVDKFIEALLIIAIMLSLYTSQVISSLTVCGLLATISMVALGILSEKEAREAVSWDIYIIVSSTFGLGYALQNSGISASAAGFVVAFGETLDIGDAGLYGAAYLATVLLSNLINNSTAAALLFPIAQGAAEASGLDRLTMTYSLMLGASASFSFPPGYTTNLLIYGPGGYKYKDFFWLGIPMQISQLVITTVLLSFPHKISAIWGLTIFLFSLVLIAKLPLYQLFTVPNRTGSERDSLDNSEYEDDDSSGNVTLI